MTTKPQSIPVRTGKSTSLLGLIVRRLVLLGTPLAIAIVLWFHPPVYEEVYAEIAPVVDTWFLVHLLYLPLLGLLGVAFYLLLNGFQSRVATVGRFGVAMFAVFYIPMEASAGIATGILIQEGQALSSDQQEGVAIVVQELFTDPIVGGGISVFAILGILGYLVAAVGTALVYRRAGTPRVPVILLSASVITVFHGFITGSLGMVFFFVAVAWLEFGWAPTEEPISEQRG